MPDDRDHVVVDELLRCFGACARIGGIVLGVEFEAGSDDRRSSDPAR